MSLHDHGVFEVPLYPSRKKRQRNYWAISSIACSFVIGGAFGYLWGVVG